MTSISLGFFRQFAPSTTPGTYPSDTPEYRQLTSAVQTFADGFVEIAAQYTPSDGGLAEQFNKSTGLPVSAADLTWSYASVLTAAAARAGSIHASWGAQGLTVPTICIPNSGAQVFVTFNVNVTTQLGGTCISGAAVVSSRLPTADDVFREYIPYWIRRRTQKLVAGQRATFVFCELSDLEQYVSITYLDVSSWPDMNE